MLSAEIPQLEDHVEQLTGLKNPTMGELFDRACQQGVTVSVLLQ